MTSNFAPQGTLGATLFPELAHEINQRKLTGGLRLTQGQVKKVVYFERGEIYAVSSNLAQESVLALLERTGRLDQARASEVKALVAAGKPLGEALIERGGVTREELAKLRAEQVAPIISSLCEWEEGDYQFDEGVRVEGGPPSVATRDLILGGVRRVSKAAALWRAVGDAQTQIKLAPDAAQQFSQLKLQPQEAFLLTRLEAPIQIGELLTISGLSEEETLRSVYALYCAGIIKRTGYTAALKMAAQKPSAPPVQPQTTAQDGQETIREIKRMARLVTESKDDYEILGIGPAATQAEVKRAYHRLAKKYHPDRHQQGADAKTIACLGSIFARIRQAYEAIKDRAPLAGEATAEAAPARKTQPAPAAAPPPPVVNSTTQAAAAVSPTASSGKAQSTETKVAAEAERRESVFNAPQCAEINYQGAVARYEAGDIPGAIEYLNEAVQLAPDNATYHAQLANLLAHNPRRRKQAEIHLLRAIELDRQNPTHHIHLGLLYKVIGFLARAESQFVIALNLDPLNKTAGKELKAVRVMMKQPKTGEAESAAKTKESAAGALLSKLFKRK